MTTKEYMRAYRKRKRLEAGIPTTREIIVDTIKENGTVSLRQLERILQERSSGGYDYACISYHMRILTQQGVVEKTRMHRLDPNRSQSHRGAQNTYTYKGQEQNKDKKEKGMVTLIEGSTSVYSVEWHASDKTLTIVFKRANTGEPASIYRYQNVNFGMFSALLRASSKGRYIARTVKAHPDQYPCERLPLDAHTYLTDREQHTLPPPSPTQKNVIHNSKQEQEDANQGYTIGTVDASIYLGITITRLRHLAQGGEIPSRHVRIYGHGMTTRLMFSRVDLDHYKNTHRGG